MRRKEKDGEGGREVSERGRLSAAEYLTAEQQFDTLAPFITLLSKYLIK